MENSNNLARNAKNKYSAKANTVVKKFKCADEKPKKSTPSGKILFKALVRKENTDHFPTEDILVHKVPATNYEIDIDDVKPDVKSVPSNNNNESVDPPKAVVERDDLFINLFIGEDDLSDDSPEQENDSGIDPLDGIGEETCNDNVDTLTNKVCSQNLNAQQPTNTLLGIPVKKLTLDVVESNSRRKQKITSRMADLVEKVQEECTNNSSANNKTIIQLNELNISTSKSSDTNTEQGDDNISEATNNQSVDGKKGRHNNTQDSFGNTLGQVSQVPCVNKVTRIGSVAKRYKCNQCRMAYVRPSHLEQHKRVHSGERPFKCNLCEKAFRLSHHLRDHGRVHTGERPFRCPFCNNCYSTSGVLRDHVRSHTGERPYICTLCKQTFRRRRELRTHEIGHKEVKVYGCSQCDKNFNGLERLKIHEKTHLTDVKYKCPICNKSFQEYNLLKVHEKIHSKDTPYKCSYCEKEFRSLDSLRLHTKNHTEKPFKCSVCLIAFGTSTNLKQHERRHIEAKKSLVAAKLKAS